MGEGLGGREVHRVHGVARGGEECCCGGEGFETVPVKISESVVLHVENLRVAKHVS